MEDSKTRYEFFKRDQEIEVLQASKNRVKRELEEQAELLAGMNDETSELKNEIAELKEQITGLQAYIQAGCELLEKKISDNTISLRERLDRQSDRLDKLERAKP